MRTSASTFSCLNFPTAGLTTDVAVFSTPSPGRRGNYSCNFSSAAFRLLWVAFGPFTIDLHNITDVDQSDPTQMYLRLGELPLYLSRSSSEGGFKRMKDGYFKTQAISPAVEEVCMYIESVISVPMRANCGHDGT